MVKVGMILKYEVVSGHNEAWVPVHDGEGNVVHLTISGRECEVVSVGATQLIGVKFDDYPYPINMIYTPSDFVVVRGPEKVVYWVYDATASDVVGVWERYEDALEFAESGKIREAALERPRPNDHNYIRFNIFECVLNDPGKRKLKHIVSYEQTRSGDWTLLGSLEVDDE